MRTLTTLYRSMHTGHNPRMCYFCPISGLPVRAECMFICGVECEWADGITQSSLSIISSCQILHPVFFHFNRTLCSSESLNSPYSTQLFLPHFNVWNFVTQRVAWFLRRPICALAFFSGSGSIQIDIVSVLVNEWVSRVECGGVEWVTNRSKLDMPRVIRPRAVFSLFLQRSRKMSKYPAMSSPRRWLFFLAVTLESKVES